MRRTAGFYPNQLIPSFDFPRPLFQLALWAFLHWRGQNKFTNHDDCLNRGHLDYRKITFLNTAVRKQSIFKCYFLTLLDDHYPAWSIRKNEGGVERQDCDKVRRVSGERIHRTIADHQGSQGWNRRPGFECGFSFFSC